MYLPINYIECLRMYKLIFFLSFKYYFKNNDEIKNKFIFNKI